MTQQRHIAHHTRTVSLMGDITRAALGNVPRQQLLQMLADRLGELHQAEGCFLALWHEELQTAVLGAAFGPFKNLFPKLLTSNAMPLPYLVRQENSPLIIPDIRHSRFFSAALARRLPIRALLALPLALHNEHLGAIILLFAQPQSFTGETIAQAQQSAAQTSLVLAKEKLLAEMQQRSVELESLAQTSASLRGATRLADMLPPIVQLAHLENEAMSILFLVEPGQQELIVAGWYPEAMVLHHVRQDRVGVLEHLLASGHIYLTQQLADDALASELLPLADKLAEAQSNLFLPLHTEENVALGVLYVGLCAPRDFTDREIRLLTAVAEIAVSAFHRALILESLEQRVEQRTRELGKANDKLHQLDRLRSKFVNDMSHELRTPVTTLRLYLDLLERSQPDKIGRYVGILKKESERLSKLIDKALALSRLDFSWEQVALEKVDFNGVVQAAVNVYQVSAETAVLTLTETLCPLPLLLSGSPSHLEQMVAELLDNAIRYTKQGGITVTTTVAANGQEACFTISDSGTGVAAAETPHLFDRFYRGEQTGQYNVPGVGLGLSLVQEIVALHQGRIEIESEVGVGTAVTIYLPLITTSTAIAAE
jgi:signal transduction histidine kinase